MRLNFLLLTFFFAPVLTLNYSLANTCGEYIRHEGDIKALAVVAKNLEFSLEELCQNTRMAGIHLADRTFYNEQMEPEEHTWVTLHYQEYSCQYFVRKADLLVTRKNCYNTW